MAKRIYIQATTEEHSDAEVRNASLSIAALEQAGANEDQGYKYFR